jgi:hypothetical protein
MPRQSARKISRTGTRRRTKSEKTSNKSSKSRGSIRRTVKRTRKSGSDLKKYFLIGTIFFAALLFIFLAFTYNKLTQSIVSADSPTSYSILEQSWYSVLVEKDEGYLFSMFDLKNGRIVSYRVSPYITLDLPGKFGEEAISKAGVLGSLDGGDGKEMVDQTVTKMFGIRPDKHITAKPEFSDNYASFYKHIKQTDLSLNELYSVYKFVSSLSPDKISIKDFDQSYVSNAELVDEDVKNLTFDSPMSLEKKSISILNGARAVGLAGYGSRIIENSGGYVVSVGNSSKEMGESVIICDDIDSATVHTLSRQLGIKKIVTKAQTDITDNEVMRSDVVVILGVDKASVL